MHDDDGESFYDDEDMESLHEEKEDLESLYEEESLHDDSGEVCDDDVDMDSPTTRSTTAHTVEEQVDSVVKRLTTMGLYEHLVLTKSAEKASELKLIQATMKPMARFLVWTHLFLLPESVFSAMKLKKWMFEVFSKHGVSVAQYCHYMVSTNDYKPATVCNHLYNIRELADWFCRFYSREVVQCKIFFNVTERQLRNYSAKKKKYQKHALSLESLVRERKMPSGDISTHLKQVQDAVREEINSWGLNYIDMMNNHAEHIDKGN